MKKLSDLIIGDLVEFKLEAFNQRVYKVTDFRDNWNIIKLLDLTYGGETWWQKDKLKEITPEEWPEYFV